MVEKLSVVVDVKPSRRVDIKSGFIVVARARGSRTAPLSRQGERKFDVVALVVDTVSKSDASGLSNSVCTGECDHVA